MADLSRVLEIRDRRLTKARRAESAAAARVGLARHSLSLAQHAVDAYAEEIRTLEIDLLNELVDSELTRVDFARLEIQLKQAAIRARKLAAGLEVAAAALSHCEAEAEAARQDRRVIQSKTARIGEMVSLQRDEARAAALLREDAELEAFAEVMAMRRGAG